MNESIRKFSYSLFTMFLAVTAIFIVLRATPGDPVEKILGPEAKVEEIAKMRSDLGLDKPLVIQFKSYLVGIVNGDIGSSLFKNVPVTTLIKKHMQPTAVLAFVSVTLAMIIGTMLGIWAGFKKSGYFDNVSRIISLIFLSFPIFSLAPILVYIFAIKLRVLPVSEWGTISQSILPLVTLVIPLSAVLMRVSRNKLLEESSSPWVQVLKSKGMADKDILIRLTKVCMPTILNVVAIQLSVVLAGTMITETIFDIPGMGLLLFEGIQNRDYPVVQGVILYSTVIYMGIYFIVDFINAKIDPRIVS
ncbi:ABC transporter permease [Halobacteriovorax sp. HLS]|uniref:ABC transporter permease n=1 Tax=Halobacteriovorax sp. HLS TaxID=2234000 RepID=UPI000FD970D8|nr:ABC transporter permease [Halobacteriovorax sp. HLS]